MQTDSRLDDALAGLVDLLGPLAHPVLSRLR
jgi:hypothetical protein